MAWARSLTILSLGLFTFVYSIASVGIGESTAPGPGMWPMLVGGMACVAAIGMLIQDHRSDSDEERFDRRARRVGWGLLSIAVFIYAFPRIGFVVPALLLALVWFRLLGKESWRLSVGMAVFCSVGGYLLFDGLLGVRFPDDLLIGLFQN